MQRWTKTKPNRPGYWWGLRNDIAIVYQIILHQNDLRCYCNSNRNLLDLNNKYFTDFQWGSSPLCEPIGEKI